MREPRRTQQITILTTLVTALSTLALGTSSVSKLAAQTDIAPAFSAATVRNFRETIEPAPEFGGEVYVLEAGPRDAPPLVLIHGLGQHAARDFEPILAQLSERHHVLAFDLPGVGRSTHARDSYTPTRYVRFIGELIARHFSGPVAVLGHSMGGALAIQYAADHPERVSQLALLDVAGILYYREYLLAMSAGEPGLPSAFTKAWRGAQDFLLHAATSVGTLEDLRLGSNPLLQRTLPSGTATALLFIEHDFGPALQRVRAPTWLGWGQHDRVAPSRTADVLRFMLRPARDELFTQSKHVPMLTEPKRVADSLEEFLTTQPLAATRLAPVPLSAATRSEACAGADDRVFEGDYHSIDIRGCRGVKLRNVRTHSLKVADSTVELINVQVVGDGVGPTFAQSHVRWTGGRIVGRVCIESDSSQFDLAGVVCKATHIAVRERGQSGLRASVSSLGDSTSVRALHGEYKVTHAADGVSAAVIEKANLRTALHLAPLARKPATTTAPASAAKALPQTPSTPKFVRANLEGHDFTGADLRHADMRRAQLRFSNLTAARLEGADLRGARVTQAHAQRADFRGADLRKANFEDSDLSGADLRGARLERSNLSGARLTGALVDANTRFPAGFTALSHGVVWRDITR